MNQNWPSVVDPHKFAEQLHDTDVVVVEVSRDGSDEGFRRGHIPGARYVHWKDFAWVPSRRQFRPPKDMAQRLGDLGAGADTRLLIYGDVLQYGVYVAWAAELAGHSEVSVLDGAKDYWRTAGLPLTGEVTSVTPVAYRPVDADHSSRIKRGELLAELRKGGTSMLDVRSPEEYTGARVSPPTTAFDNGAASYGHIPGARHFYFERFLDGAGRFRSRDDLRTELASVGVYPQDPLITYCRLGHRAAMSRFVLTHVVGFSDVRVYDGSWTEWGSLVDVPVATGIEPGSVADLWPDTGVPGSIPTT